MLPTTPQRATHDYERNGTCDVFAALEITTERSSPTSAKSHTSADFVALLNKVSREVPKDLEVHVIFDNLSTTRPRRSTSGCFATAASTSPPPTGQWRTSSSGGSPSSGLQDTD